MKNAKVKTALAAVTLAAATLATPLAALAGEYNNYKRDCSDTSNAVLGAIVGGTAGAAIGDGIAGRGQSTEVGILGAIIGGVAGAAVGDSASDCENDNRYDNRSYGTTTSYPTRTYGTTTTYPSRTYGTTTTYPSRTYGTTSGGYQTVGHRGHSHGTRTTSYGYGGSNNAQNRLYQIDREIQQLKREKSYLKDERRRSRGYRPGIEQRLDRVKDRIEDLERERKRVKKYAKKKHNTYHTTTVRRGHYHGSSRNLCYGDH